MRTGRFNLTQHLTQHLAITLSLAAAIVSCASGSEQVSRLDDVPARTASGSTSATTTTPALVPTPTTPPPRPPRPTSAAPTSSPAAAPTTSAPAAATAPTLVSPTPSTVGSTTTAPGTTSPSAATAPPAPLPSVGVALDSTLPQTSRAFETLARNNAVASITVRRDGVSLIARASGALIDGTPATSDSPMLVASVSKIVTAVGIARLVDSGDLVADQAVPWSAMGISPHAGWNDVTVRELLDHTSGMPVARTSWFGGGGDCGGFLPTLLTAAPQSHRGTWRYSNGNYCALGLLVEALTGQTLDAALQALVFDPIGEDGIHSSTAGLRPTDAPHGPEANRFSRLGGAGTFIVSTDDLTAMTAQLRPSDMATLRAPGIFVDQYGWGHTGTIDGAVSCLWVLEGGRTTVAATIAGNSPATGGDVCDRVVPAVANDLGIGQGVPVRTP